MASRNTSPSLLGPRMGSLRLPQKPAPVPDFEDFEADVPLDVPVDESSDPSAENDGFGANSQVTQVDLDEMKPIRRSFCSWTDPKEAPESFQPNRFTHEIYTGYLEKFMSEVEDNQQLFKAVMKQRREDCGFEEPSRSSRSSRSSGLGRFWKKVGFTRWGLVWWTWTPFYTLARLFPWHFPIQDEGPWICCQSWFLGITHDSFIFLQFADLKRSEEKDSAKIFAYLRITAQCGFSTPHRFFHSIFRSKSSSMRDWLSAKRMTETMPPSALQIYRPSAAKRCVAASGPVQFPIQQHEFPMFPVICSKLIQVGCSIQDISSATFHGCVQKGLTGQVWTLVPFWWPNLGSLISVECIRCFFCPAPLKCRALSFRRHRHP